MNQSQPLLSAHDLSFSYGEREILRGIDLTLYPGQVLGLLGPNGTGKSTLLGLLAGDLTPASGQVLVKGLPVASFSRQQLARERSVMPQIHEFPFAYTVRDIVEMGRLCWRDNDPQQASKEIVAAAMTDVDITDLADREVTRLSGGERARVTLARVLAQQTPIVFLDEPTAALDIAHQQRTMQICKRLAATGAGVITVMHDIQLAASYCTEIVLLDGGRVYAAEHPAKVLNTANLSEVYGYPIDVIRLHTGQLVILPQS